MVAFAANITIMYLMGYKLTLVQNFWMTVFFTIVSVIRGYYVRRLFNWLHMREII